MRGVTCMKRTQGQATDGMLLEITSTSDGHGDRLQVRQQQTSRSPSEQRSQLGQAVQTKPTLDQANQTDSGEKKIDDTRSRGAHMISPNNREEPDDHGTSAQSASLQDQHATDVEMTDFINLIKVDAHYESSATASATDSPNILSQPGDGQHITEAVLRVQNNHQARSPPNLFLNIATAPSHPQAQGNSARGKTQTHHRTFLHTKSTQICFEALQYPGRPRRPRCPRSTKHFFPVLRMMIHA